MIHPPIEAACEDCLALRAQSGQTQWWCARHAERHVRGHAYRYRGELPFAQQDAAAIPVAVDEGAFGGA